MKKIAILGATGYIGRSLVREFFLENKSLHLCLFSRSKEKLHTHIKDSPKKVTYSVHSYNEFEKGEYDVIINCTGISGLSVLKNNPIEVFEVTEEIDSLIIGYLQKHSKALYINLSSGAVYGDNFEKAQDEKTKTHLAGGFIGEHTSYAIAKINAEAKHRALPMFNIVDIRVFAFFSSLVDTDSLFLMTEVVKSLRDKKVFITNKDDIIRDYATAKDLLALIKLVIVKNKLNDYFDLYSKKPISKFALLQALAKKYGLTYSVTQEKKKITMSSSKNVYCSHSKKATKILGYKPELSSLQGTIHELSLLLQEL